MTRATTRHVDHLLIVAEAYFKSMETARRYHHLASDLGIPRIEIVGNKVRPGDDEIIEEFCSTHGFELATCVPFDDAFIQAERRGMAPIDHAPDSVGVVAISELADRLSG